MEMEGMYKRGKGEQRAIWKINGHFVAFQY